MSGLRLDWWGGIDTPRDGVNTVKSSGEDEVVVGVELLKARSKGAVVDEATWGTVRWGGPAGRVGGGRWMGAYQPC